MNQHRNLLHLVNWKKTKVWAEPKEQQLWPKEIWLFAVMHLMILRCSGNHPSSILINSNISKNTVMVWKWTLVWHPQVKKLELVNQFLTKPIRSTKLEETVCPVIQKSTIILSVTPRSKAALVPKLLPTSVKLLKNTDTSILTLVESTTSSSPQMKTEKEMMKLTEIFKNTNRNLSMEARYQTISHRLWAL